MVTLITTMTGCGFVSPGNSDDGGNRLVYEDTEKEVLYRTDAAGGEATTEMKTPYTMNLTPTVDYGFVPNQGGLTEVRDAAGFMYASVFSSGGALAGYPIDGDRFKGDDWGGVPLDAGSITANITNAMTSEDIDVAFNAIETWSMIILVVMWAFSYMSMIANERFTPEAAIKGLLQLAIGALIIDNANVLADAFVDIGNSIIKDVTTAAFTFDTFKGAIAAKLLEGPWSWNIGFMVIKFPVPIGTLWVDTSALMAMVFMFLPMVVQVITAYKIASIMFMRMIELKARLTFAPIPLAFSLHNGFGTEAIRYFRELLACVLQPALIMVGVAALPKISEILAGVFGTPAGGALGMASGAIIMCASYLVFNAYLGQVRSITMDIIVR